MKNLENLLRQNRMKEIRASSITLIGWMLAAIDPKALPKDPAALVEIILEQHRRIEQLERYLVRLRRWQFGSKSERVPEEQLLSGFAGETEIAPPQPEETGPGRLPKRRPHGRRPLPPDLPRHVTLHDVPEPEKRCPSCGEERTFIGYDERKRLEYQPACFFQDVHLLKKYVCTPCQKGIVTAPAPVALGPVERGIPGPGLVAHVMMSKWDDHLPWYRQSEISGRSGLRIARSTLCDWMAVAAELLSPVVAAIKKDVLSARMLQTDDTVVRLIVPGLGHCKQARLWGYLGNNQVVYEFSPSREQNYPLKFLENYKGGVQCDACKGYDKLFFPGSGRIEFGCNAHNRRYWFEAKDTDPGRAFGALGFIRKLYAVEDEARDLAPEDRVALRRAKTLPIFLDFKAWVERESLRVRPQSPTGVAVRYTLGQWSSLIRYVDDGEAEIDTNAIERLLRGVAVSRKNFLFVRSEDGGRWAATAFTLIESAKLSGIDPYLYLKDVLTKVWTHPQSRTNELMPRLWARQEKLGKGGERCRRSKPFIGTQQVTNPARQRLATSRNRVLRGGRATCHCEAYTGSAQGDYRAPKCG